MKDIKAQIDKAGVVVLADAWLAGAIASKKGCIRKPDDIKGLKVRSAGPTFAAMWQAAGASIVSIPSNEVYNALQTGVADATDTSSGSFVSFRIYEQVKCVTAPGDNALWFMYEPVLMSKKSFDRLEQEAAGRADAGRQEVAGILRQGSAGPRRRDGARSSRQHNVEVVTLTPAEYDAVAQGRREELVRRVRQGSAERQEADRRSAQRQVAAWTPTFAPSGACRRSAASSPRR